MKTFVLKTFIILPILILSYGLNLPVKLKSSCSVNFLSSAERQNQLENILVKDYTTITNTYTHYVIKVLTLKISQIVAKTKLGLNQGYIQFAEKRRSSYCIVFVLYLDTFTETTTAIQSSGFATSDNTIVCVYIGIFNKISMFHGFSTVIYNKNLKPFHAVILFFDNNSRDIFILCYFCTNTGRFHSFARPISQNKLIEVHNSLYCYGYNKYIKMRLPAGIPHLRVWEMVAFCFNIFPNYKFGRDFLIKAISRCPTVEMLMLSPIQAILNVTISPDGLKFPTREWDTVPWFIQIVFGESLFQRLPVNIQKTRGFVYFSRWDLYEKVIACTSIVSLSSFDFSIMSAVDKNIWILLIAVISLYAIAIKSISKGLDILCLFFSISCQLKHRKEYRCYFLIPMVILSASY